MTLFRKTADLQKYLSSLTAAGKTIGFVPTMGALHAGHLSLIQSSKAGNSISVCSIFVNPTQFNVAADFQKYPVTLEKDILALEQEGCDVLFLPSVDEVYPPGTSASHYDIGFLETVLEGKYRPGHFQGVCQVVDRLLEIVRPSDLYLGQKDYQQCMVIRRLLELKADRDCELHVRPTLREPDGLAMSSRNMRLTKEERAIAPAIYESLIALKKNLAPGALGDVKNQAVNFLEDRGFKVDYVEIAHAHTLQLIDRWDGKQPLVVLAAAFLNDVRLIDNVIV